MELTETDDDFIMPGKFAQCTCFETKKKEELHQKHGILGWRNWLKYQFLITFCLLIINKSFFRAWLSLIRNVTIIWPPNLKFHNQSISYQFVFQKTILTVQAVGTYYICININPLISEVNFNQWFFVSNR